MQWIEDRIERIPIGGCWIWMGTLDNRGYGKVGRVHGQPSKLAHRYVYENYKEPIPKGKLLCHTCDNPSCVNPSHMFVGTQKDNMSDCVSKGRFKDNSCENSPVAKLNRNQVDLIRIDPRDALEVAKEYNISRAYVYYLRQNKGWKSKE